MHACLNCPPLNWLLPRQYSFDWCKGVYHIYRNERKSYEGFDCSAGIFEKLCSRIILWHLWQTLVLLEPWISMCVCVCVRVCSQLPMYWNISLYEVTVMTSQVWPVLYTPSSFKNSLSLPFSLSLLFMAFSSSSSLQRFMWATYTTRAFNFTPG